MILRLFYATPHPGAGAELNRKLQTESIALATSQKGMVACAAAGSALDGRDSLFLTIWEDSNALDRFAGPDHRRSVLPDGYAPLLEDHHVVHRPVLALRVPTLGSTSSSR